MNSTKQLLILGLSLLLPALSVAQIDGQGMQYMTDQLGLSPGAIDAIAQGAEPAGKNIRWATLGQKTFKLESTLRLRREKRRARNLQRTELGRLAVGLRRTLVLFKDYYEKFSIVSSTVQSLSEWIRLGERIARVIGMARQLGSDLVDMDHFSDVEREVIARPITTIVERTEALLVSARFAVTGANTNQDELDDIAEEHGDFLMLMRSLDRTEQLAALDRELGLIVADLDRMVSFIANIQNIREHGTSTEVDALRRLHSID